jgi:hypothetical protein
VPVLKLPVRILLPAIFKVPVVNDIEPGPERFPVILSINVPMLTVPEVIVIFLTLDVILVFSDTVIPAPLITTSWISVSNPGCPGQVASDGPVFVQDTVFQFPDEVVVKVVCAVRVAAERKATIKAAVSNLKLPDMRLDLLTDGSDRRNNPVREMAISFCLKWQDNETELSGLILYRFNLQGRINSQYIKHI